MARVGYPFRRLRNVVSNVISAPSRFSSKRRGDKASQGVKAVKFLRQVKRVPADPKTKLGRKILNARLIKADASRALKKRK